MLIHEQHFSDSYLTHSAIAVIMSMFFSTLTVKLLFKEPQYARWFVKGAITAHVCLF